MKYRKDKDSKPIPILLDKALRDRIEKMSGRMGEAKSTVMRMAMRLGLETLEAAMEIKPSILHQLAADSRSQTDPGNSFNSKFPSHQPQSAALNEQPEKKKKAG